MKHTIVSVSRTIIVAVMMMIVLQFACATASAKVDLAQLQGWDIVLPDDAIATEVYAAEEFQALLAKAGGVKLPIVRDTTRLGRKTHGGTGVSPVVGRDGRPTADQHIFIGPGAAMKASKVGFSVEELGGEDLHIVVGENNIAIAGGRPRGTLWGVYTFLEDYLGVRFLTPEHTHIPPIGDRHVLDPVDRVYRPPFARYRGVGSIGRSDSVFAIRSRANNLYNDPRFGFGTPFCSSFININHSFYKQVPLKKYAKTHPEYYGLWDGKRRNDSVNTHLCLTNPDLVPIVTQAVFEEIEHPASAGRANFSVAQNDTLWQYCQDKLCAEVDSHEDSHMGALLQFVNSVADRVAEKHPGAHIGTLAYGFSRKPPKFTKPRPNVEINLAYIEACQIHAFNDPTCPFNIAFMQDIKGWSRITDQLSAWTYIDNFNDPFLPYPNLHTIKPNIQVLVDMGVKGAFMQSVGQRAGEMSDLRHYMTSRLMWNPGLDDQQLLDEFLTLHYGKAAPPIRRFIDMVQEHYRRTGMHHSSNIKARWYLPVDELVARKGLELFAQAMELAENETVKTRVEKISISAWRAAIAPVWNLKVDDQVDPTVIREMRPRVRKFFQLCQKYHAGKKVAEPRQRLGAIFKIDDENQ